ncbi:MAG: hypothetical protein KDA84_25740, partial [Planctomycetaceae bacterium]|nr:hypothetical protein [Planctomycetaceae bacterium]
MSWVCCLPSLGKPVMARQLSASRSLRSSPPLKNQVFEVPCACGELLTGIRQTKPQTLPCPHCGAPIFVLPLDCYAEAGLHRSSSKVTPSNRAVPGGVIAKLNRLAF